MKTTIATLAMMLLLAGNAAWSNGDSTLSVNDPAAKFDACVNLYPGSVIQFRVVTPDKDLVILKVYSDWNIKVLDYEMESQKALKLDFDLKDMRKTTYTCVVERNGKEVIRKEIKVS